MILVYILILKSPLHHLHIIGLIPKEATIFVINFVVTWQPGLNDLTLHIIFNIILLSGHAIQAYIR